MDWYIYFSKFNLYFKVCLHTYVFILAFVSKFVMKSFKPDK